MIEESNVKTITVENRDFLVPNLSAFEQKEIYFKIRPVLMALAIHYGQQGFEFSDDVLENMLSREEISKQRQWLEDILMRGVREHRDGKNLRVDIESFHNCIHSMYVPLLVEILKHNFKDFFYSLKSEIEKIGDLVRARTQ